MKILYIVLTILLVLLSFFVIAIGFKTAEGAPQECVAVGLACFLAILARIAQAAGHNFKQDIKKDL